MLRRAALAAAAAAEQRLSQSFASLQLRRGWSTEAPASDTSTAELVAGAPAAKLTRKGRGGRFAKKLTRKQRGSYSDSLPQEVATWPQAEHDGPVYNTRDIIAPEGSLVSVGPFAEVLRGQRPLHRPASLPDEELQTGHALPPEFAAPYAGASRVLHWHTRIILSAGNDQRHALSNKVEVTLKLSELSREVGLSPAGVAYIRALCGLRYTPATDTLRLVSQRYLNREDNRRDLLRIIDELIDEGAKEGGGLDLSAPGAGYVVARQQKI